MTYTKDEFDQFAEEGILAPSVKFPWGPTLGIGLPVAAISAGFIKTKSGKRVWDHYYKSLRYLEGAVPMGFFQTFHGSELISPFAAPNKIDLRVADHPDLFKSKSFQEYLSHTTGKSIAELKKAGAFNKGLFWKKGKGSLGELRVRGGNVIGTNVAAVSTGARRSGFLIEWLGHVLGVKNPAFLKGIEEKGSYLRPGWLFAAGGETGSVAKLYGRMAYASLSSMTGRMNLLLKSPFDLDVVKDAVAKVPILNSLNLGVKAGPAHKMLWRYTLKGGAAFGVYKALDYADYLGREYGVAGSVPVGALGGAAIGLGAGLRSGKGGKYALIGAAIGGGLGLSGEGPISLLASTYANVRVTQAGVSDKLGLREGAQRTEDYFPGLTSPATMFASALTGLLLGGVKDWGERIKLSKTLSAGKKRGPRGGAAARDIFEEVEEAVSKRNEAIYNIHQQTAAKQTGVRKVLSEMKARYYGHVQKGTFKPSGAGRTALIGVAAYQALNIAGSVVSGDISGAIFETGATATAAYAFAKKGGALGLGILLASKLIREKEDPEKLKRIYRGEEEVAVKAGRFWEAGRCNHPESLIKTDVNSFTLAKDLKEGDRLIGSDGELHSLLKVYERNYEGEICCITTNLDRNIQTKLTPNHIVPVLRPFVSHNKETRKSEWCSKNDCILQEVEAGDIQIGDFVQVPISNLEDKDQSLDLSEYIKEGSFIVEEDFIYSAQKNEFNQIRKSKGFKIPRFVSLSDQLGRLIGYFLSDGNLSFKDNLPSMIEFAFSVDEEEYASDIFNIIKELFGLTPTIRKKDTSRLNQDGCLIVRICCSLLARIFFDLFYESSRCNLKSFSKLCLKGTRSFRAGIVKGFWRGDGHLDRGRKIISSSRVDYIEYLRVILLDLGFSPATPKVEVLPEYIKKNGKHCVRYRIGWNDQNTQGFVRRNNLLFVQIVDFQKESFSGIVYDFEIDHKDHLLQNGTFLVHNSPYSGGRAYYRPHRIALMRSGADKAALYGSEQNYWASDPLFNPVNFLLNPYEREELMWEQGYKFPVSKTPFEDLPVLGPLLAGTIGRIIKPAKFLGQEEWLPEKQAEGPMGMLETPKSEPIMRTSLKGTIGEQAYRLTELFGLPGFVIQSMKEQITGTNTFFEEDQWATPSLVSGSEPTWWSGELGGMALMCIPAGSPVQTSRGIIPIEEVKKDDQVLSRDSKFHQVKNISSRKATETIKVVTSCLNTNFEATPNHVIPVYEFYPCHDHNSSRCIPFSRIHCLDCTKKDKSITTVDKPVEELRVGDFLEVPLPIDLYRNPVLDLSRDDDIITENYIYFAAKKEFIQASEIIRQLDGQISRKELRDLGIPDQYGKEALNSWKKKTTPRRFSRYISVDSDLAYILGWYAAEGSISSSGVLFTLNINERKYAEELGLLCKAKFGATFGIYEYPNKNSLSLVINSPVFRRCVEILIGKGSHQKEIHPSLYYSSKENRAEFLRGYISGDGFLNIQKGKRGISTVSRNLAIQSFLIGLSLGFRGHTTLDYLEKPNGFYPQGDKRKETLRHYVCWSKTTVSYLEQFLNQDLDVLSIRGKNKGSFVSNDHLYIQIKELIQMYEEKFVHDLEIDDLHYFTAQFISVHNSEGIRRYIPHKRNEIEYRNPLPSGLPSWLPGSDSGYFLDFSRGDVYSKIKEPWARLPGLGLAAINPELKGVDPENYSDFWRFKVLADVAPWSKEYGQYNELITSQLNEGRLAPDKMLKVNQIRRQVQDVKKAKNFQQYHYDDSALEKRTVRITEELEPGKYLTDQFGTAPITLAGLDTSLLSLANIARNEDASLSTEAAMEKAVGKQAEISDFLRQYVKSGTSLDVYVNRDPSLLMERGAEGSPQISAVFAPGGENLNRALVERGLAISTASEEEAALSPLMATGGIQRAFGSFWENLSHGAETPLESFTPIAPVAKFVHKRTALEDYQRSEVYGRDVALWQKPIEHFIKPGLATTAHWAGWRGVPSHIRDKYMLEEYFDKLEYEKWNRLQRQAQAENQGEAAALYLRQAQRTKTGGDIYSEYGALAVLSSKERNYFREFVHSPTAAERREISGVVSPQLGQVLQAQWSRQAAESAQMRQEAGISQDGDQEQIRQFEEARAQRDAQLANQPMNDMPVPGPNWVGWDRNAQVQDYKVKTIQDKNLDASNFGVWASDFSRIARRPWVQTLDMQESMSEVPSSSGIKRGFNSSLGRSGYRSPTLQIFAGSERRIDINSPGRDRLERYLGDPSIMNF